MADANYTKIGEVTVGDLADYLHLTEYDTTQEQLLITIKAAAVNYIIGVTGLTVTEIDNYPDLTLVLYCLAQNLFDNRSIYIDKVNLNDTVDTVLNMYRTNLL